MDNQEHQSAASYTNAQSYQTLPDERKEQHRSQREQPGHTQEDDQYNSNNHPNHTAKGFQKVFHVCYSHPSLQILLERVPHWNIWMITELMQNLSGAYYT